MPVCAADAIDVSLSPRCHPFFFSLSLMLFISLPPLRLIFCPLRHDADTLPPATDIAAMYADDFLPLPPLYADTMAPRRHHLRLFAITLMLLLIIFIDADYDFSSFYYAVISSSPYAAFRFIFFPPLLRLIDFAASSISFAAISSSPLFSPCHIVAARCHLCQILPLLLVCRLPIFATPAFATAAIAAIFQPHRLPDCFFAFFAEMLVAAAITARRRRYVTPFHHHCHYAILP